MDSSGLEEQAALVALLRSRPGKLSWPELTTLDPEYPARLRGIQQAPPVLFTLGAIAVNDVGVSVVGSREASAQGIAMADELAREFVARKLTVISGLARGIDTAAHRAALDAGGRTVAVIGRESTGFTLLKTARCRRRSLRAGSCFPPCLATGWQRWW